MNLSVSPVSCPQNHRCPLIAICPVNAIKQEGHGLPVIDDSLCIDCGTCMDKCPRGAIVQK